MAARACRASGVGGQKRNEHVGHRIRVGVDLGRGPLRLREAAADLRQGFLEQLCEQATSRGIDPGQRLVDEGPYETRPALVRLLLTSTMVNVGLSGASSRQGFGIASNRASTGVTGGTSRSFDATTTLSQGANTSGFDDCRRAKARSCAVRLAAQSTVSQIAVT